MSAGDEDVRRDEIVIVRRRSDGHEGGHHGGAWKIAYADFMTAMMALFLVMWLVNAASKDTRAQVASYFNPIKLSDSITSPRGLSEMQPGERSRKKPQEDKHKKPSKKNDKEELSAKKKFSDTEFFSDPHGVLAKLAKSDTGAKEPPKKGDAFRDPFDPAFRQKFEVLNPTNKAKKDEPPKDIALKPADKPTWAATVKRASEKKTKLAGKDKNKEKHTEKNKEKNKNKEKHQNKIDLKADEAKQAKKKLLAQALQKKLDETIGKLNGGGKPIIKVTVNKDGVVLSLTDQVGHSMFDIGSAVPKPGTVTLADTLSAAIKEHHKGSIVISGHTDGRAFSSGKYDNWRLSTDRAHAFYHMLSRGGVDMSRVSRVQGFAAQRPKVPSDLNSPLNRRVEITLQTS